LTSPADNSTGNAEPEAIPAGAILCLALGAFGSGVSLRVNDALLPRLAEQFSVPISTAAQVISYFAIAYGLAQLLFGPLGDRFGKYRVIAWGCAASAVTALLCSVAPDFPLLTVARALAGVSVAAIIPLAMAWIGDVVPYEKRQPVLARFLIGQILGLSAGVWLGGFAADHLNWRLPYFAIGVLFAAVSAAQFMINRRLPAHARKMQHASGSALRRIVDDFGHVLARPWARKVLVTVFLEGAFLYGPFAFIASHLHHDFGVSLSLAGSLVMLFGFGGVLYAVSSTQFVARLGEVGLVRGGGVILTAAMLGVALAPAWWWAVPSCLFAGLGFYMLHNTLQINATQMAPERRGAAVSAFASCFFLGQSAGVVLAGALADRIGTGNMIAVGAIGVLAVALNFGRLRSNSTLAQHR
jgi:predicted MFS family arabinose efflux permease